MALVYVGILVLLSVFCNQIQYCHCELLVISLITGQISVYDKEIIFLFFFFIFFWLQDFRYWSSVVVLDGNSAILNNNQEKIMLERKELCFEDALNLS